MMIESDMKKIRLELTNIFLKKYKNFPQEIINIIINYISDFKLKQFKDFEGIYYIDN